jgi:hypothetical protein
MLSGMLQPGLPRPQTIGLPSALRMLSSMLLPERKPGLLLRLLIAPLSQTPAPCLTCSIMTSGCAQPHAHAVMP